MNESAVVLSINYENVESICPIAGFDISYSSPIKKYAYLHSNFKSIH